jgi:hypothetical protein
LHLILPVPANAARVEDAGSRGVTLHTLDLDDAGVVRRFVHLVCHEPDLEEIFAELAADVLGQVPHAPSVGEGARQVLGRWRELLERPPRPRLGPEQLAGLFGELLVLRRLVQRDPGALSTWTGPRGQRHDFESRDASLEVKTTTLSGGSSYAINGLDQLEARNGCDLFLVAIALERVGGGGGRCVPDLVDDVLALGADRATLLDLLDAAGYSPAHAGSHREVRFDVRRERIHDVGPHFPRLIAASLVGGALPGGVSAVHYRIELTATTPGELGPPEIDVLFDRLARTGPPP